MLHFNDLKLDYYYGMNIFIVSVYFGTEWLSYVRQYILIARYYSRPVNLTQGSSSRQKEWTQADHSMRDIYIYAYTHRVGSVTWCNTDSKLPMILICSWLQPVPRLILPINSMEQENPWVVDRAHILKKLYSTKRSIQNSQILPYMFSPASPINLLTLYLFHINFNIIFPQRPRISVWRLGFRIKILY
jgi:hypothetical protein